MQNFALCIFSILVFSLSIKAETNFYYFYTVNNDSLELNDSLSVSDSTLFADSLLAQDSLIIIDTLKPLFYSPIRNSKATSVTKNKINRKDYRYTGDLINQINGGFLRDLGTFGQPSEITFLGLGFNNLSINVNGVDQNNRITNSFNAYSLQTENIDSIIVHPLTQSFIYNNFNNPISIEVIEKDSLYSIPYSRIKFYQAPYGEGMFDGRASLYLSKRINLTIGTSNQSMDSRYNNSDFSNWLGFAKIRYMLSNYFNFIIDYSYRNSNTSLFGGVDLNAIAPSELETILYDPLQAPVNYEFSSFDAQSPRYQKSTSHNFSGKILSTIIPFIKSDLTFYYQQNLDEFRQNQFTKKSNLPEIIHDNSYQTFGINYSAAYTSELFDASIISNFESNEIESDLFKERFSFSSLSLAGIVSLNLLNDFVTPTGYVKNITFNGNNYFGFGLDAETNRFLNFSLGGGISYFEKPYNFIEQSITNLTPENKIRNRAFQFSISYKSEILKTQLSYFFIQQDNAVLPIVNKYADTLLINEVSAGSLFNRELKGYSLNGGINYWLLGIEYNGSYYIQNNSADKLNPEYFLFAGIYYKDILFNKNLNLKTGFNFYLYGKRFYYNYDFEKSIPFQNYIINGTGTPSLISSSQAGSNFKMDFFLSARIQESAIFFFVFENILDAKYFIVPYYPTQGSGLRFGVAWEFLD